MSFRYILRYYIDPLWDVESRIEELLEFCLTAHVEEVMLFISPEELSAGHPTPSEIQAHIELGRNLRNTLSKHRIDLSLNPWSTIYHNPRGRKLRKNQNFRLMVGDNGVKSTVSACPLCPQWQDYLASTFAILAQEIQPVAIWIEDDWRLRNHGLELGWGGCFCEEHLSRMASFCGKQFTRESLLQEILRDPPNSTRDYWLLLNRISLIEPATKLANSIRATCPSTEIGLMSSNPDAHSVEGRDWSFFRKILSKQNRFLSRPNMPPYTEAFTMTCPPSVTRLTISNTGRDSIIYPELENSPRCGIYSKSHRYSEWQMLHAVAMGSRGITINHYDMLGNGISLDANFAQPLARRKLALNRLTELELSKMHVSGLRVLFHPDIAAHLNVRSGTGLDSMVHDSTIWGDIFFNLGIPWDFTRNIEDDAPCTAVSGQTLRAFSEKEIERLLSSRCLLDGESLRFLIESGYGDDVGVSSIETLNLSESGFSYEEILVDLKKIGISLKKARMTLQRCTNVVYDCSFLKEVSLVTKILRADHKHVSTGAFYYKNKRGGEIFSLSYPLHRKNQLFMAFFNYFRQGLFQQIIMDLSNSREFAVARTPGVQTYQYSTPDYDILCGLNATADDLPSTEWLRRGDSWPDDGIEQLETNGTWKPSSIFTSSNGDWHTLTCTSGIRYLDAIWLRIKKNKKDSN